MEDKKALLLEHYAKILKQFRATAAGRGCTSSRDFLHGKVTEIRVIALMLYGEDIRDDLRKVEET